MALLIKNSESLTKLSDIAKKWRQDTIQKAKNTKSM
jgi:hypothetical protein